MPKTASNFSTPAPLVAIAGWLIPGAGYLLVGQKLRGIVKNAQDEFVQNRVSIDRFTGGALETALFNEQPVFGGKDSRLTLTLCLREPGEAEIGLLLQLLKDLWTGDLPVGGQGSVGRGRLQGFSARLIRSGDTLGTIAAVGERLQSLQLSNGLAEQVEKYAEKLKEQFGKAKPEVVA